MCQIPDIESNSQTIVNVPEERDKCAMDIALQNKITLRFSKCHISPPPSSSSESKLGVAGVMVQCQIGLLYSTVLFNGHVPYFEKQIQVDAVLNVFQCKQLGISYSNLARLKPISQIITVLYVIFNNFCY